MLKISLINHIRQMKVEESMNYPVNINGIDVNAQFDDKVIQELFVPLLEMLSNMH